MSILKIDIQEPQDKLNKWRFYDTVDFRGSGVASNDEILPIINIAKENKEYISYGIKTLYGKMTMYIVGHIENIEGISGKGINITHIWSDKRMVLVGDTNWRIGQYRCNLYYSDYDYLWIEVPKGTKLRFKKLRQYKKIKNNNAENDTYIKWIKPNYMRHFFV